MERQYLLKTDLPDERDYLFKSSRSGALPNSVDLRPNDFPEILDQYWLGACTGFAAIAIAQCMERIRSDIKAYFYLNPLFVYRGARELIGSTDYDSGAYIRDALKVLKNVGACTLSRYAAKEVNGEYVLDFDRFKEQPSEDAIANAALHKINAYYRIGTQLQLKQALVEGLPVAMGIEIFNSFESEDTAHSGYVKMPDRGIEYSLGGHAVAAYGYTPTHIICRNSWGKEWGDKGYFYLPWDFLGRYITDMWVVK